MEVQTTRTTRLLTTEERKHEVAMLAASAAERAAVDKDLSPSAAAEAVVAAYEAALAKLRSAA